MLSEQSEATATAIRVKTSDQELIGGKGNPMRGRQILRDQMSKQ